MQNVLPKTHALSKVEDFHVRVPFLNPLTFHVTFSSKIQVTFY